MPMLIEPDSAIDWMTIRQICDAACRELVRANPNDPKAGRIDLYRLVTLDGKSRHVRIKLTIA
jgi:hypothetical protein